MAAILKSGFGLLSSGADWAWNYCDPRTCHLYMTNSPVPVLSIIAAYLYFVKSLGPKLMKKREPFNLRKVMLVYNAVQVVWCGFILKECIYKVWNPWGYRFTCEPLSTSMEPFDYDVAWTVYLYFLLKIVDLLDTVFMVLRKSFRQISFLHVYHHAGMVFCIWIGAKGFPGGHHTFVGFINSFVHCLLYGYYFLSLYDPTFKVAWWKKYITIVQIVQFGLNIIHEAFPLFLSDCNVNNIISTVLVVQNIFMFTLFTDFYLKTYYTRTEKRKTSERNK